MKKLALVAIAAFVPLTMANLVELSMDSQINLGSGDAIYPQLGGTIEFPGAEGDDLGTRFNIDPGGSWWYGPRVDLTLTSFGAVDISGGGLQAKFDARLFQDSATNSNAYGDANIFFRMYSYDGSQLLGWIDYGIVYGPSAGEFPFGDWANWNTVMIDIDSGAITNYNTPEQEYIFDPTKIAQFRMYGTNWTGGGDDYIEVKDFVITPEPASLGLLGLTLLGLLRRR